MIQPVHTNDAPKPVGPYSPGIRVNGFVFCSGQAGVDPKTEKLVEGIENQTRQVFSNLKAVLQAAGSDLSRVVKTSVFLTHIEDFKKMNAIYADMFGNHKPARTTIEASDLPLGALVEIEMIATYSPSTE